MTLEAKQTHLKTKGEGSSWRLWLSLTTVFITQ